MGVALDSGGGDVDVDEAVDDIMTAVIEEAEDVEVEADEEGGDGAVLCTVVCEPSKLHLCHRAVCAAGHEPKLSELQYVPTQMQPIDADEMEQLEAMLDAMDDNDDILEVFHNAEVADAVQG